MSSFIRFSFYIVHKTSVKVTRQGGLFGLIVHILKVLFWNQNNIFAITWHIRRVSVQIYLWKVLFHSFWFYRIKKTLIYIYIYIHIFICIYPKSTSYQTDFTLLSLHHSLIFPFHISPFQVHLTGFHAISSQASLPFSSRHRKTIWRARIHFMHILIYLKIYGYKSLSQIDLIIYTPTSLITTDVRKTKQKLIIQLYIWILYCIMINKINLIRNST